MLIVYLAAPKFFDLQLDPKEQGVFELSLLVLIQEEHRARTEVPRQDIFPVAVALLAEHTVPASGVRPVHIHTTLGTFNNSCGTTVWADSLWPPAVQLNVGRLLCVMEVTAELALFYLCLEAVVTHTNIIPVAILRNEGDTMDKLFLVQVITEIARPVVCDAVTTNVLLLSIRIDGGLHQVFVNKRSAIAAHFNTCLGDTLRPLQVHLSHSIEDQHGLLLL
jgi:hypothetical protein